MRFRHFFVFVSENEEQDNDNDDDDGAIRRGIFPKLFEAEPEVKAEASSVKLSVAI